MSSETPEELLESALRDHGRGDIAQAIQKLRRTLELAPRSEDAAEMLAVLLYNEKQYDAALDVLKNWIRLNPRAIMAHTNLSRCYVAKGMIMEAEAAQAEARKLGWMAELASKKSAMPVPDFEERIARYRKVIEFDPADVLGYFSLGSVYLEAGKPRDAADTFEKAVSVNAGHSASYFGWGQALEGLGDKAKARKVYIRGIEAAEKSGDMMTQKKMESRLHAVEKEIP